MTAADDRPEEFQPPTALESAVRALGADTIRYRVDYIMLPMRDGIRLATVVFRPRAEGPYPTLLVRSPYAAAIPDQFKPMHTAQFKKNYVLIMQNERGSEWSEGDFGVLTATTADAQDTLDWISAQEWSNGKVGLHGCSSTAENQLKLGAIGHPALRACVPMSSEIIISWFDRFLCDEPDAWQPMPKVQVFLMGACTWLTGESWPLPETETRTLLLASDTSASTLWGDGALVPAGRGAGTDEFIADPHNPVQSLAGDIAAHDPICVDQRVTECRADVLVYSTPVLTEPIAIVGDVSAELYVSADVEDADVFVKLVDVYPDGTAYNLADGCLRLRYRDGFDKPAKLVPGEIHRVRIGGITTANYFPAGHRIRIEIAGSNFPLADRNWHAGDRNDLATDGPIAHLTLHHGKGRESALHFRAYTGEITVNTPTSGTRSGSV